jgi:hypothetical protein
MQVNQQRFRLNNLRDHEVRSIDVGSAMRPGNANTIQVRTLGPRDSTAMLVISD